MLAPGVALAGALGLLTAAVYAALGRREAHRAGRNGQLASAAMALFWWGLGLHVALDSAWGLAAGAGLASAAASNAILHLKVATGALAFTGLVYHLVYVYSGRDGAGPLVALYFLATFALVEHNYLLRGPIGHEMTAWAARHAFALEAGALEDLALVALFLPGLVASLAYANLIRAAGEGAPRRRVLLQATALAGFFGGMLVGFVADFSWWEPVERALGLATGLVAYVGSPAPAPVAVGQRAAA